MANRVKYTSVFEKYFKRYSKKFRSISSEILELEKLLIENPKLGTDIGDGLFKIRLAVKSKNKGKRGGFRVVTYLVTENENNLDINLIIIYDKSEIEDIPKKELLEIVKEIFG
ncbi:MAG: type II toxin-antitoxin system RelE/ParE family toxin [Bacteroidales bacterium]|nr:type II toxin-antitoxin system RelE/ParE family toxin [Bacteroidales bacterium]